MKWAGPPHVEHRRGYSSDVGARFLKLAGKARVRDEIRRTPSFSDIRHRLRLAHAELAVPFIRCAFAVTRATLISTLAGLRTNAASSSRGSLATLRIRHGHQRQHQYRTSGREPFVLRHPLSFHPLFDVPGRKRLTAVEAPTEPCCRQPRPYGWKNCHGPCGHLARIPRRAPCVRLATSRPAPCPPNVMLIPLSCERRSPPSKSSRMGAARRLYRPVRRLARQRHTTRSWSRC